MQTLQPDARDPHELVRLIEHSSGPLHRFFRRRGRADADDLTQATLLGLLEARERFRGDSSPRTFLFSIARHQLYASRRASRRASVLEPLDDCEPSIAVHDEHERAFDTASLLARAMHALSPSLRRVLVLSFWEELTQPEIAARLGIPLGTVASRIRLAKEKLRQLLVYEKSEDSSDRTWPPRHCLHVS